VIIPFSSLPCADTIALFEPKVAVNVPESALAILATTARSAVAPKRPDSRPARPLSPSSTALGRPERWTSASRGSSVRGSATETAALSFPPSTPRSASTTAARLACIGFFGASSTPTSTSRRERSTLAARV